VAGARCLLGTSAISEQSGPALRGMSLMILSAPVARADEWPDRIRALAGSGKLADALKVTEEWMAGHPGDFEAATWHARVLGWQGRNREAEFEFRLLLKEEPDSIDVLAGLAAVLNMLGEHGQALEALDRACPEPAGMPE